ncbi:MAG: tRNA pseudouridine(55) synthase TruB, partial [Pyrinomonadaceae bacterium]|nr:tRNA pseudouridine(55) synthase TruB [Pyrinomonadaceae bacterium]
MQGILIIDKPAGFTSHDVVACVRRRLKEKRVGHTGTLDPFATGVLVVLVGRATRLAQFLSNAEKEYEAVVRFGYATETGDATGEPKEEVKSPKSKVQSPRAWTDDEIEAALQSLRGAREQVPPMYSAKKVQGRKLYELARRGEEIERKSVPITIHQLEAVRSNEGALLRHNEDGTCDLALRVVCSAGTYIRVLAEEIGERFRVGAHLASLRRTRAGQFHISEAVTLDALQEKAAADILLPPDAALSFMPFVHLTNGEARRAMQGVAVRLPSAADATDFADGAYVRMRDERGSLIAV